jgi:hypothetical protein
MNVYLARLRTPNLKIGLRQQPSKPSKPSFEGYGGDPGIGVLKNQESILCLQCGGAIGPGSREITVRSTGDGQLAIVHQDCLSKWQLKGPATVAKRF